jgi:hypothetical protein
MALEASTGWCFWGVPRPEKAAENLFFTPESDLWDLKSGPKDPVMATVKAPGNGP